MQTAIILATQLTASFAFTVTDFATGFSAPADIVFDSLNNLYVAEINTGIVKKVTPTGTISTFASGFLDIFGLAYYNGDVYVAGASGIAKVNVQTGAVTPNPVGNVYDVAFGLRGEMFYTSRTNSALLKISVVGAPLMIDPAYLGLSTDNQGSIFYSWQNYLKKYTDAGLKSTVADFSTESLIVRFSVPDNLGNIYVSLKHPDFNIAKVAKIFLNGSISTIVDNFMSVNGLALDSKGDLYVAVNSLKVIKIKMTADLGESCSDGSCSGSLQCINGKCQSPVSLGGDCRAANTFCSSGTCFNGTCQTPVSLGGDCTVANSYCSVGTCISKKCQILVPLAGNCSALNSFCSVGTCDRGQCEKCTTEPEVLCSNSVCQNGFCQDAGRMSIGTSSSQYSILSLKRDVFLNFTYDATGSRVYSPIIFTKRRDASTPLLFDSLANNKLLNITFSFVNSVDKIYLYDCKVTKMSDSFTSGYYIETITFSYQSTMLQYAGVTARG